MRGSTPCEQRTLDDTPPYRTYLDLYQGVCRDEGVERSYVAGLDPSLPDADELLLHPPP